MMAAEPFRAGAVQHPRRLGPLQLALLASVAVHVVVLAVRFVPAIHVPQTLKDPPLEVILVNTRGHDAPQKAQALAQANLAGGGEAAAGRATSPLPVSERAQEGDSFEDAQQRNNTLHEEQMQLLAQVRQRIAQMPQIDPNQAAGNPDRQAQEERRRQLSQVLAEIEKRINEENARPKRRFISPATRESASAMYYDALRQKIERRGTTSFPQQGGQKLYGQLIMQLTVDTSGRVLEAEIVQGSGNLALDRQAIAIATASGPFGRVTPEMIKGGYSRFVFVSRFRFTRDNTLEADLRAP